MKLERVVSGQGDAQSSGEELRQRVAVVTQEERVVAQRRHRDEHLRQVVQVLQHWHLRTHATTTGREVTRRARWKRNRQTLVGTKIYIEIVKGNRYKLD